MEPDHKRRSEACRPQTQLPVPPDLLTQIFTVLGFHDRLRCQRVCKAWNALLRDPQDRVWGRIYMDLRLLCELSSTSSRPSALVCISVFTRRFLPVSRSVRVKRRDQPRSFHSMPPVLGEHESLLPTAHYKWKVLLLDSSQ